MENIIINDKNKFEEKKEKILQQGRDKFHVLADFDLTLTKANVDGIKTQAIMKYLRNGNYLTSDYVKKANELYEKYHPIEIDPSISKEDKIKKMKEWWETHFDLMAKTGLDKKILEKLVNDVKLEFREGVKDFLGFLNKNDVPLVIISSSGIGSVIPMYLKREGLMYDNISIVANLFEFDKNGVMVSVKKPIIHSMNKYEITLHDLPIYNELEKRKNVMLLGDSLGDLGMIEGFKYNNLISIGFLNEKVEENLRIYKNKFDVVVTNDGKLDFVNEVMKEF